MADGKQSKVRRKKSEQHRRIRRRESWAREEKEIKELEDRCRDVSCRYPSLHRGKFINELIFGLDLKHCHVLQTLEKNHLTYSNAWFTTRFSCASEMYLNPKQQHETAETCEPTKTKRQKWNHWNKRKRRKNQNEPSKTKLRNKRQTIGSTRTETKLRASKRCKTRRKMSISIQIFSCV